MTDAIQVGRYVTIHGDIYEDAYYKVIKIRLRGRDCSEPTADVQSMYNRRHVQEEKLSNLSLSDISKEERRALKKAWYERNSE